MRLARGETPSPPSREEVHELHVGRCGPAVERHAGGGPPIVGLGAQLTLVAFLVVMLLVPWIMALRSTDAAKEPATGTLAGTGSRGFVTSARERHLWLLVLAVMVAIYSTLGPAQEVAVWLRQRNLLGITSWTVMLVIVAAFAVPWLRERPGRVEVGAAVGVAAVYVATLIRLPVPEARSHLFEYGLVAILIYQALLERRRNGRRAPVPWLIAWGVTVLLGWVDEAIQLVLPNRVYDLVDVGFNAVAASMAIAASLFMGWARRLDLLGRVGLRGR